MAQKRISIYKASGILELYELKGVSKVRIAKSLNISLCTVDNYVSHYKQSELNKTDLLALDKKALIERIFPIKLFFHDNEKSERLIALFPGFHKRLGGGEDTNLARLWTEYTQKEPSDYNYIQFSRKYHEWRRINNIQIIRLNKWEIDHIEPDDLKLLKKWRLSTDRHKWEKAVAVLELHRGVNITDISQKVEKSSRAIKRWVGDFKDKGLGAFELTWVRKPKAKKKREIEKKTENVIKLLHESPSLHIINRTSWSLDTLAKVYKEHYGESISPRTVCNYIHKKGFTFRKAKEVLTSPDPDYCEKLNNIKRILSGLKENEKFFSIDEYGPFAVNKKGGGSYTLKEQKKIVPQNQISKGRLIITAALELSKNQITHFYSDKINTAEMIKLLIILLENYKTEDRIYLSWDAASWHVSKELDKKVSEVNDLEYRRSNNTPSVELAPLPISAQFLNVIESVFSGLVKAVIHNSDYQSVDECKKAIDRYFAERNAFFNENPKQAGKKIWGQELVKAVFKDSNTCKDPNLR